MMFSTKHNTRNCTVECIPYQLYDIHALFFVHYTPYPLDQLADISSSSSIPQPGHFVVQAINVPAQKLFDGIVLGSGRDSRGF